MVETLSIRQSSRRTNTSKLSIFQFFTQEELSEITRAPLKITFEIVDGKECFVAHGSFKKPLGGLIDHVRMVFEKSTIFLINTQMRGRYQGLPFIQTSHYTYEYLGEQYHPLKVGKECKIKKIEIRKTTALNETQNDIDTYVYIYRVEGIEEIIVPAGIFRCFKIVQYDSNDDAMITHWESTRTNGGYKVKSIDHQNGEIIELISARNLVEGSG